MCEVIVIKVSGSAEMNKGEPFQQIVLGGLAWALGNVDADVTPNIEKAAPKSSQLATLT